MISLQSKEFSRVFSNTAVQKHQFFGAQTSLCSSLTSKHDYWKNHRFVLCCPLLLPSIFPSIRVFSNESVLRIKRPKYWRLRISPSNEYSGLISFRMDWLDLLAVQETLKSLQHHSSKASILQHSAFFTVQLSHPYMLLAAAAKSLQLCLILCNPIASSPPGSLIPGILQAGGEGDDKG